MPQYEQKEPPEMYKKVVLKDFAKVSFFVKF